MKRLVVSMMALMMVIGMVSCGEKKGETAPKPKKPKDKITVYQVEETTLPEWYYDDDATVKKEEGDRASFIYFKMMREAPTGNKAAKAAKGDLKIMVAEAIKNVTSTEMIKATEGMLNDAGEMDEYFSETVASISRNVDTGGMMPAGRVVEHLAKRIPGREGDIEFFRCTVRYKMDYQVFVDRLMGLVKKQAPRINEKLKEQGSKLLEETKMRENMEALAQ